MMGLQHGKLAFYLIINEFLLILAWALGENMPLKKHIFSNLQLIVSKL